MNPEDKDENNAEDALNTKNGEIEISEELPSDPESPGDIGNQDDKYQELHKKYLRLAADFENYKKRLAKEKADTIAYANEDLIKALLNVLDNLERALEHAESNDEASSSVVEGVILVHKQFISCLEKFGVDLIDTSKGAEFDPRIHQAIERVESNEVTPGLLLSEMLKGYTLKERLLRPALVVVSKGVPDTSIEKDPVADSDENQKKAHGLTPDDGSETIFDLTEEDIELNEE